MRAKCAAKALTSWRGHPSRGARYAYLFFILPLGSTAVVGGVGRVEAVDNSFGGLVSFLGFFVILLLR